MWKEVAALEFKRTRWLSLGLVGVLNAEAATLTVPAPFPTIGAAFAVATSGDIVLVGPGTYAERLTMPNGVILRSTAGRDVTVIDGEERGRVLEGSSVVLDGFTIVRGRAFDNGGGLRGSGTVINCIFEANTTGPTSAARGGALNGNFVVANCIFRYNGAFEAGGAISGTADVTNCAFIRNNASAGWGGAIDGGGSYRACYFEQNTADDGAQAAYLNAGGALLEDCVFTSHAGFGGVVRAFDTSPVIRRCTLYANTADALWFIGAIGGSGPTPLVESCTLVGNRSGVISDQGNIRVTVTHNILAHNTYGLRCFNGASGFIGTCNDFWQNTDNFQPYCESSLGPLIEVDPRFCDATLGNFQLRSDSPCRAGAQPGCAQIGAWSVGCGFVATTTATWSGLKNIYR
jgi:predicted outer membrane repeat protein